MLFRTIDSLLQYYVECLREGKLLPIDIFVENKAQEVVAKVEEHLAMASEGKAGKRQKGSEEKQRAAAGSKDMMEIDASEKANDGPSQKDIVMEVEGGGDLGLPIRERDVMEE